jgi:hypothetical protein
LKYDGFSYEFSISELTYLAELCGFEVVARYGNYYKSTEETGRYVWILKKIAN